MISAIKVTTDAAGFPIATWTESRGIMAPGGPGTARVECRIMKEAETGTLMLVARGTKRHGAFEEGKPWEAFRTFSVRSAEELYYTKAELAARHHMANKGLGSKLAWSDGGHVVLGDFAGDTPLHVNCADATQVDLDRLHVALTRAFVDRHDLVSQLCKEALYRWPIDDEAVETYDPTRYGWPGQKPLSPFMDALLWVLAVGIVGGGIGLIFWLLRVI